MPCIDFEISGQTHKTAIIYYAKNLFLNLIFYSNSS